MECELDFQGETVLERSSEPGRAGGQVGGSPKARGSLVAEGGLRGKSGKVSQRAWGRLRILGRCATFSPLTALAMRDTGSF